MPRSIYVIGPSADRLAKITEEEGFEVTDMKGSQKRATKDMEEYAEILCSAEDADFLIADLDGPPDLNVAFTIGYAVARMKTVISYRSSKSPLPLVLEHGCYKVEGETDLRQVLKALDPNRPPPRPWGLQDDSRD